MWIQWSYTAFLFVHVFEKFVFPHKREGLKNGNMKNKSFLFCHFLVLFFNDLVFEMGLCSTVVSMCSPSSSLPCNNIKIIKLQQNNN